MKRLLACLFSVPTFFNLNGAAEKTVAEWTFDQPGDLQGWQPNGHVRDARSADGVLTCRTVGHDPMFILGAPLEFRATPWQVIELRIKADGEGGGEFFWSNTGEGKFGGFSQAKTTDFHVAGDNEWRVLRLFPFWQSERKIVKLRLDLFDGATFAIASIRIVEESPPPAAVADFDFTKGLYDWRAMGDADLSLGDTGAVISVNALDAIALAPPANIPADTDNYVSLRMSVDRGDHATLFYATDRRHGLQAHTFPIRADGEEQTYNVDMLNAPDWGGRVLALGLRPSEATGVTARVRWLKVSEEPQGEPQLRVISCALEDALPRVGSPVALAAIVANAGGEPLRDLRVSVELPDGVRIVPGSEAAPSVASLGFSEETRFEFKIQADRPVAGVAVLRFVADNLAPVEVPAALGVTPRLQQAEEDYVPVPKPVRGPTEVGVYYFPGWNSWSRWQPLQGFPERKPVLGWYREGDPEVADWHIKWAVEHGITWFAYDWYWNRGARHLEHGLHDGYFKARYRRLLKFCLLWANHNPPGSSSHDDCLDVTRYWIENYFRRPEHLTVEGKPVMILFSPHRLSADLGPGGVKKAFDAMREECRQAGLKGLYLVACVGNAAQAKVAAEEGYDAVSAYNWPGLGLGSGERRAPFSTLPEAYRHNWERIVDESPIPLIVPVSGGWDSRPWHGDAKLVRYDRTPELFRQHLADAKTFLHSGHGGKTLPNLVLIEAWNEWGEGSYIEPHNEFGFGYLDAIRDVFTDAPKKHADFTPADVGLGPYELPPPAPPRTAWDFADDDQSWNSVMQVTDVRVENGALLGRSSGNDPAFFSSNLRARSDSFSHVVIRMKLTASDHAAGKDRGQLFWATSRLPENEAASERFDVQIDGEWRDYRIDVRGNRRWKGLITRLRLDPCNRSDIQVAIESIRLAP